MSTTRSRGVPVGARTPVTVQGASSWTSPCTFSSSPWVAVKVEPGRRPSRAATAAPTTASKRGPAGSKAAKGTPSTQRTGTPRRASARNRSTEVPTMRNPCRLSPSTRGTARATRGSARSRTYSDSGSVSGASPRWKRE